MHSSIPRGPPSPPNLGNPEVFDCDPHPGMENFNFACVWGREFEPEMTNLSSITHILSFIIEVIKGKEFALASN